MHKRAMEMMADGDIDLSGFLSKIISLEDFADGMELARRRPVGFVKAVFVNE